MAAARFLQILQAFINRALLWWCYTLTSISQFHGGATIHHQVQPILTPPDEEATGKAIAASALTNIVSTNSTSATPLAPASSQIGLPRVVRRQLVPPHLRKGDRQGTLLNRSGTIMGSGERRYTTNIMHRRCASTTSSARPNLQAEYLPPQWHLLYAAINRHEENSAREILQQIKTEDFEHLLIRCSNDEEGHNLIHYAAAKGCPSILLTILESMPVTLRKKAVCDTGLSVNNYTPLHVASLRGDKEAAEILLHYGAQVNAKSKLLTTPLHLAITKSVADIARLLLEHGADPNAITKVGSMPLLSAVHKRSVEMVQLLLANGANPRLSPEAGLSPRALALQLNAVEILDMMDGSVKNLGHRRVSSSSSRSS